MLEIYITAVQVGGALISTCSNVSIKTTHMMSVATYMLKEATCSFTTQVL